MATAHFHSTPYKRSSDKAGAAQRVQYIQRAGIYDPTHVPAKAKVGHLTKVFGEKLRDDLVHTDVGNLPVWAGGNAVTFFAAAEKYERANGTTYTEWKFSLPRELNRDQQLVAARDMLATHFGTTRPYVWAMHEPTAADGGKNPHVHVIWSSRMVDGIDRTPDTFFKRYDAAHPERGGARKAKDNTLNNLKDQRRTYTDIMNMHLERAGSDRRLHPDSHRARGLERAPEPHVLPSDSNKAKEGKITEGWAKVLASRAERELYEEAELRDAHHYWERRKIVLGITPEMDKAQVLARIDQGRGEAQPQRLTPVAKARLVQDIAAHATLGAALDTESAIVHARTRVGRSVPSEQEARIAQLEAQGNRLTRGNGEREPVRQGTHARRGASVAQLVGEQDRARSQAGAQIRLRNKDREEGFDIGY